MVLVDVSGCALLQQAVEHILDDALRDLLTTLVRIPILIKYINRTCKVLKTDPLFILHHISKFFFNAQAEAVVAEGVITVFGQDFTKINIIIRFLQYIGVKVEL